MRIKHFIIAIIPATIIGIIAELASKQLGASEWLQGFVYGSAALIIFNAIYYNLREYDSKREDI